MHRTTKRLPGAQSQDRNQSLPPLNPAQFSAKLDELLSKVSVQNRYAARISQCNIRNMEELQRARKELQRVAEERKLKQLREGSDHDMLEQLMRRANTSEEELKNVFKELVDAKRAIKNLKKEIGNLQKSNLQLEKQVLDMKRERYFEVSAAKQEVEDSLLATQVKTYLASSERVSSVLYQHCLIAYKSNQYVGFLMSLQEKLEGAKEPKKLSHQSSQGQSVIKVRLSSNKDRISGRKERRFKTEHFSYQLARIT